MKIRALAALSVVLACLPASADVVADFHDVQDKLDDAILDTYDNSATPQTGQDLAQAWSKLKAEMTDPAAQALVPADFSFSKPEDLAAKIGASRAPAGASRGAGDARGPARRTRAGGAKLARHDHAAPVRQRG